jgi:CoA:oxalate CoA-transferase
MSICFVYQLPLKTGPAIADAITGLTATTGLLVALWSRERTGRGAHLDIAMVDAVFACLENTLANYDVTNQPAPRQGNADSALAPFDSFAVDDGWVVIGIGNDGLWRKLAQLVDPALASDARFATNTLRLQGYDALRPMIAAWCARFDSVALLAQLHQAGIPAGRVRDMRELACDARLDARNMLLRLPLDDGATLRVPGCPIQVSGAVSATPKRAPRLGEHTKEVLSELAKISSPPPSSTSNDAPPPAEATS